MNDERGNRGGCVGGFLGAAAVLVLAPIAFLVRSWRRWRRGSELLTAWRVSDPGGRLATLELDLDRSLFQGIGPGAYFLLEIAAAGAHP